MLVPSIRIQHALDRLAISVETAGHSVMAREGLSLSFRCQAASTYITTGSICGAGMHMVSISSRKKVGQTRPINGR